MVRDSTEIIHGSAALVIDRILRDEGPGLSEDSRAHLGYVPRMRNAPDLGAPRPAARCATSSSASDEGQAQPAKTTLPGHVKVVHGDWK